MGRTIGIDLGTTNTAVAVFEGGRPKVIADDKGYKVLPSVVSQKDDGSFVVGEAAKNLILTEPHRTVYAVKRLIGRRFDSEQVQQAIRMMPYEISEAPDGRCQVRIGDTWMSPIEVSAIVLQVAKQIAERSTGGPIDEAVITVPAYFTHAQRAATMEAAQLAGLACERLLNEPTAAALAYGHRKDIEKNILIYDLGGGTFDVSVLHLSHGVYEVLATSGDSYLGGEDFDLRIVDWLAEDFLGRSRVDLRKDPTARQRLKEAAERAKCELSFTDKANLLIPRITSRDNLEEVLTRTQLEELVGDLIDRTVDITRDAVNMAMLRLQEIDDVVLVGGQTRMPRVREAISGLFGKEPNRSVHPEEVVAVGAAVHAQALDHPEEGRTLLIDVTPFDLGIDAAGGFFSPIVERNSRVPITRSRTFTTARDNQDRVRITVRQGGAAQAAANEFLGEFVLTGIAPAPRMEPKLDVNFRIDANGLLHVAATDRATGERQQIVVKSYAEAAANPQMPTEEQIATDAVRRAALSEALGEGRGEAALLPEEDSQGGLAKLAGLFRRGKKKKAPGESPTAGGDDDVPDLDVADLDVGDIEELDAEDVEAADLSAELPTINLAAPPAFDDDDELEDLPAEMVEDETPSGPAAIGTALRSDPFERGDLEEERGVQLRSGPAGSDDVMLVDDGELAAAFLEQLESGSFEGFDDDLFEDLGASDDDHEDLFSDDSFEDDAAMGLILDDTVSKDPARSYRQRGSAYEVAEPVLGQLGPPQAKPRSDEALFSDDFGEELFSGVDEGLLGDDLLGSGDDLLGDDPFADPIGDGGPFSLPPPAPRDEETLQEDPFGGDDLLSAFDEALASIDSKSAKKKAPPEPLLEEDIFGGSQDSDLSDAPRRRRKKAATLRISYGSGAAFCREYGENLQTNRTFIKTPKPLSEGRDCNFEIRISGYGEVIHLAGVVTWSSRKRSLAPGEDAGMRVEFKLSADQRAHVQQVMDRLSG